MRRLGYDAAERVRRGGEVRAAANGHAPPAAAPSKAARFSPDALPGGIVDGATITGKRVVRADICVIGSGGRGAGGAQGRAGGRGPRVVLGEGARAPPPGG